MSDFLAVLGDNASLFARFFWTTIKLFLIAGVGALVLGTVVASLRVSPVRSMRLFGAGYVNVVRNTPLTLVLVFLGFAAPKLDIPIDYFPAACLGLTLYTAAFVCEAVRSGINTVPTGQAEAARAIGLRFSQVLSLVVLPQALRASIPPLVSVLIALLKNTTIATAVNVLQAGSLPDYLSERGANQLYVNTWIAIIFVALVVPLAVGQRVAERKAAVGR
ncbi:amino acid ABC transporter permease [Angustibacter luteus]|uniref:Amino acid ABC transporter permease n=1 Tax=Angustibacter luteus TaxID=658456 RepID=A0ABW1J9D3_9ACTN